MADRISVIVPVYNVAADLPRCLNSILAQTYSDIEIIAVDDGSPDNSGEILDQYANRYPNIRVIHKENGGVTSARLSGIQEATGAYRFCDDERRSQHERSTHFGKDQSDSGRSGRLLRHRHQQAAGNYQ